MNTCWITANLRLRRTSVEMATSELTRQQAQAAQSGVHLAHYLVCEFFDSLNSSMNLRIEIAVFG